MEGAFCMSAVNEAAAWRRLPVTITTWVSACHSILSARSPPQPPAKRTRLSASAAMQSRNTPRGLALDLEQAADADDVGGLGGDPQDAVAGAAHQQRRPVAAETLVLNGQQRMR